MSAEIHYEIFVTKGENSSWRLFEAIEQRDVALKKAKTMVKGGVAAGVRVMKETYRPDTGDFMSVQIFQEGKMPKPQKKVSAEDTPLCFKPSDLYSKHARATISRLLKDQLGRWRITVLELMHRAEYLERLEATDTVMQHAIQKVAVAQAQTAEENVQQIVKRLNELVGKCMERVFRDQRSNRIPKIAARGANGLAVMAPKLMGKGGNDYMLNAALAEYLASAQSWSEKLSRVLELMEALPEEEEAKEACLRVIDNYIAEMLSGGAALSDLLGQQKDLGSSLLKMADLFLGRLAKGNPKGERPLPPGVATLSQYFAEDKLLTSKAAIADRIFDELKGRRRLCEASLEDEVRVLKQLATRMVMGQGPLISMEQIMEGFATASDRLVSGDIVERHLANYDAPDAKVEALLAIEENIVGANAKRRISEYIIPLVTSYQAETLFIDGEAPIVERLKRLGELQHTLLRSNIQDNNKQQIAERIDKLALAAMEKARFIEELERQPMSDADRVSKILRLGSEHVFTKGECQKRAAQIVERIVRKPSFMGQFLAKAKDAKSAQVQLDQLSKMLEEFGIELTPGKAEDEKPKKAEPALPAAVAARQAG